MNLSGTVYPRIDYIEGVGCPLELVRVNGFAPVRKFAGGEVDAIPPLASPGRPPEG
jgi:hypothetical protein